jgi:CheY-like chemotaxis protein
MMKKKTIWIVDDDPIYQKIANKIVLKSEIFSEIVTFVNGKEAITAVYDIFENKSAKPDIILLDINMPVMDGWEFMDELSLLNSKKVENFTIYIVSSSIAVEDKSKSKKYQSIMGYISKPLTVNDLVLISSDE